MAFREPEASPGSASEELRGVVSPSASSVTSSKMLKTWAVVGSRWIFSISCSRHSSPKQSPWASSYCTSCSSSRACTSPCTTKYAAETRSPGHPMTSPSMYVWRRRHFARASTILSWQPLKMGEARMLLHLMHITTSLRNSGRSPCSTSMSSFTWCRALLDFTASAWKPCFCRWPGMSLTRQKRVHLSTLLCAVSSSRSWLCRMVPTMPSRKV
mmetsp:Transcript_6113/g.17065  ORF Transcript_6113/g.17065 Transcript_6113/m.17065 type:complete len:213 (-) Transcript_6113:485-1123(-)